MQSSSGLRTVRKSMLYDQQKYLNNFFEIITRVGLAQYDFLTPFDLRGQTFGKISDIENNPYHDLKSWQGTIIF